jgi:hypothetical protein
MRITTRSILLALSLVAVLTHVAAAPAGAWPVADVLTWDPVTGAGSYKVEKTTDSGATWVVIGTPTLPTLSYNGAEVGLVLFRISACTAVGGGGACTVRAEVGLFHNEAWRPLAMPVHVGIQ